MTTLDTQPEELPLDLSLLSQIGIEDSKKWFPYLHTGNVNLLDFYVKGMTGELGEFVNVLKKIDRLTAQQDHIEAWYPDDTDALELITEKLIELRDQATREHTDILCYWLLVGHVMGHNLEAAWRANRRNNATRWG